MLYEAYAKRKQVEELNLRKTAMVAALTANSGFLKTTDGPKILEDQIEHVCREIDDLVAEVYGALTQSQIDQLMVERDPFYTAMKLDEFPTIDQPVPGQDQPSEQ